MEASFDIKSSSGIWNTISNSAPVKYLQSIPEKIHALATRVLDLVLPRNPVNKHREFRIIPTFVENFLGKLVIYTSGKEVVTEGNDARLVKEVFDNLVAHCDRKELAFEVRLIRDSTVNAYCTPGGKVMITTALIEKLKQENDFGLSNLTFEDKLAAVLGHEITHACAGHGARSMQFGILLFAVGKVISFALGIFVKRQVSKPASSNDSDSKANAEKEGQASKAAEASQSIFNLSWSLGGFFFKQSHSKEHEFEADKYGIKYAALAGYNPAAAVWLQHMFLDMKGKKDGEKRGLLEHGLDLFATHPPCQDRLNANKQTVREMQTNTAQVNTTQEDAIKERQVNNEEGI
jgi:beta-barrel assembly-enhancing protease